MIIIQPYSTLRICLDFPTESIQKAENEKNLWRYVKSVSDTESLGNFLTDKGTTALSTTFGHGFVLCHVCAFVAGA